MAVSMAPKNKSPSPRVVRPGRQQPSPRVPAAQQLDVVVNEVLESREITYNNGASYSG